MSGPGILALAAWLVAGPQAADGDTLPPPPPSRGEAAAPGSGEAVGKAASALSPAELDQLTAEVAARLRCPVCRNQSVLESSAELSRQMQSVIRDRLAAGESPDQVEAYFVARYGEWILLKPEAEGLNLLVYVIPPLVLVGGGLLVRNRLRRWRERAAETAAGTGGGSLVAGATGDGAVPPGDPGRPPERADSRPPGGATEDDGGPPLPGGVSEEEARWLERVVREPR